MGANALTTFFTIVFLIFLTDGELTFSWIRREQISFDLTFHHGTVLLL